MTILCKCECGKSFRVRDQLEGKRVRCPECREPVAVLAKKPAKTAAAVDDAEFDDFTEPDAPSVAADDFLDGFAGLDELVQMERGAKRGKAVALICPDCRHNFRETISRADLARLERDLEADEDDEDFDEEPFALEASCPKCFAEVDVGTALAEARAANQPVESKIFAAYERTSVLPQGFISNKPLAPGWHTAQAGLNLVYIAGIIWSFTVIAIAATVVATGVIALVLALLVMAAQHPLFMMLAWLVVVFSAACCALLLRIVWVVADDLVPHAAAFIGFGIVSAVAIFATQGQAGIVLFGLEAILLLVAAIVGLIGWVQCVAVPVESGVKWVALGAAAMLLVAIGLYAFAAFVVGREPALLADADRARGFTLALILSYLFGVTAHFLFIYFLRGIPKFFHDDRLFAGANQYLVFQFVIVLVGLVLGLMMAARMMTGGWAAFLSFVIAVCGIISVTWFLRLVAACRDGIRPFFRR